MIIDACLDQTLTQQVCDVVARAENVGDDELEGERLGDIPDGFRDIDRRMKRLSEQERNDDGVRVPSFSELPGGRLEVWLRQIKVGRNSSDLCLLRDRSHEPLDPQTALRMPAAVGEPDQRRAEMTQFGQRVSRCGVWVRQRGQNFFNSRRSGSLRRFFLVM